jgi:hypothetical protein
MKTMGDLRADAEHLRDVKRGITHPGVLAKLREIIAELEVRAREGANGAG